MKRCITFLVVIATLAILLIMPFIGVKGTSDTALALTQADCRACHTMDSKTLHHSLGLQCGICHTFTWDPVTSSYNVSKITDCTVCHGSAGHEAAHDRALIDSQACAECHAINVVTEHANRNLNCEVCHKSTTPAVIAAIEKGSGPAGQIVYCSDCHGPTDHAANHDKAQINSPNCLQCHNGNIVVEHAIRDIVCADCHSSIDPRVIAAIGKGSGPNGQIVYCTDCHLTIHHESLPPYTTEDICYQCHTDVKAQFNAGNDRYGGLGTREGYYAKVNTRHDISDADQLYSSTKIECINCHNPYKAPGLADPDNTSIQFTKTMVHPGTGLTVVDSITFCLKCHDNTWAPGVKGPKTIKNIATRYLDPSNSGGEQHGAGPGQGRGKLIGPYASVENGPVPAMPCTDCHDSHGGGGIYHLKTLTDQYGVPVTITSANIGGHIVTHWCSHCHENPMNQIDGNKVGCTTRQCHSHGLNSTW